MPYELLRGIQQAPITLTYNVEIAALTATIVGNEFAVAAFVHPELQKLDQRTHVQAAAPMAAVLGKAMPIWYGFALLLLAGAAFEHRPVTHGPGCFSLWRATSGQRRYLYHHEAGAISNRIAKINTVFPYDDWLKDRGRWDRLHRILVLVLVVSVFLLLAGLLKSTC